MSNARIRVRLIGLMCLGAVGCDDAITPREMPADDASLGDAGPGEPVDAGPVVPDDDAGWSDAGDLDAGDLDAGDLDAGDLDAGAPDAGPACPRVRVVNLGAGETLNVRPAANTSGTPIASLTAGTIVEVRDQVRGQAIDGIDLWYQIVTRSGAVGFVFSRFAECTEAPIPVDESGFWLPLACGTSARVTQGNNGTTSHNGRGRYAFDFGIGLNTPVHAMAAGRVLAIKNDTRPGDACYGGGGSSCANAANYVVLRHADGTTTTYLHLNTTSVAVGADVARGAVVGRSGTTGWSTGPHLHVEHQNYCGTSAYCTSIPLAFRDVAGSGVPTSGQTVTSDNCP